MLRLEKVSRFQTQDDEKRPKKHNQFITAEKQYPKYEKEYDPGLIYMKYLHDDSRQYINEIYQSAYKDRQFEDSLLTTMIYQKIVLVQYTMMVFSLISILLSICSQKLNNVQKVLIINSILTLGLQIMLFIKYFLKQELRKKQLLREKFQNKYIKCIRQTAFEFIVLIVHPNLATQYLVINTTEPINDSAIQLQLNTLFEIIMQSRIYLLFLAIISNSIYCNTRANRLCRIYSTKNNLFFGIKSLFEHKPLTFLVLLYMSLVITLGQMISLSEKDYQQGFAVFQNSLWFIIITMGTVGYGDYSPSTYLGRIISFIAALSGIIMSSLLILTLSRYLSMSNGQNKSHVTLKRLQLRKVLQKYSKQTINFTTKFALQNLQQSQTQQTSQDNKMVMQQLKRKTQRVKFSLRRIKNIVDTDNLKQEINRLFQALSQNLNVIYKSQQQYSELLIQLYHKDKDTINKIQFSFTAEIENIIKDR